MSFHFIRENSAIYIDTFSIDEDTGIPGVDACGFDAVNDIRNVPSRKKFSCF